MRHFIYLLTFCLALLAPQFATAGSTPAKPQTEKPSRVQQWLLKKALKKQQRIQQNPKKKARWERRVERIKEDDPRPLHWSTKVCLILALLFPFPPIMLIFSIIGIVKSGKNKTFKGKGLAIGALVYSFVVYAISILIIVALFSSL